MKIYVYAIYFPTSDKYYVGKTQTLKRLLVHLNANSLVGNALRKYNNWTVEVLHTTKDEDIANLLEIEEIRHYNCIAPNGYNLTRGGEGTSGAHWNLSKETIERMRKPKSIEHKKNISFSCKGIKRSEEAKNNMRKARIGKRHSKNTKQKISESLKGNYNINAHSVQSEIKRLKTRIAKLEN